MLLLCSLFFLLGILVSLGQFDAYFVQIIALGFMLIVISRILAISNSKNINIGLLSIILGIAWGHYNAHTIIDHQVSPKHLNKSLDLIGTIVEISAQSEQKTRFILASKHPIRAKLKLSWHYPSQTLNVGQIWQLRVKLKQNNGLQNEVGFDYESYLFLNRISATGYVKNGKKEQLTQANQLIAQGNNFILNQLRQFANNKLLPHLTGFKNGGILFALITGQRVHINNSQWQRFINTNTSHLTVVSGLHIGLISGLLFLLSLRLYRICASCCLRLPAPIFAAGVGIIVALCYALFAGFSISTQRAFIMASCVFLSIIFRQHFSYWQLYGLALFLVLLFEPLSVISAGFWLSFYAVGLIIYGAKHYQNHHKIWRILFIQLLITLAMLPLLLWFFNAGNPLAFLANIIAVPVVSFITLPFSLFGAILVFVGLDSLAFVLFYLADLSLIFVHGCLDIIWQYSQYFWLSYNLTSVWQLGFLLFGFMLLFLPKGLGLRYLGLIVLAVILLNPNTKTKTLKTGEYQLVLFDAGQGLASLIKTKNHTLLFDAGFGNPTNPDSFNIGQAVIKPYLDKHHIKQIDTAIISHGDSDHSGGFGYLTQQLTINNILSSSPQKVPNSQPCYAGQSWGYDGVSFTLINPPKNPYKKGNNNSCVLRIDNGKHRLLLTGDIEKQAEKTLSHDPNTRKNIKADILLVPHHGSKTSSTHVFLNAVNPSIALNSSGYQNRFRHPHPTVKSRYLTNNIRWLDTQCAGQITLLISDKITVKQHRPNSKKYWIRQCD